ncbi:unnamed protein product, partial [Discosporangium mesarthrocarpum]
RNHLPKVGGRGTRVVLFHPCAECPFFFYFEPMLRSTEDLVRHSRAVGEGGGQEQGDPPWRLSTLIMGVEPVLAQGSPPSPCCLSLSRSRETSSVDSNPHDPWLPLPHLLPAPPPTRPIVCPWVTC